MAKDLPSGGAAAHDERAARVWASAALRSKVSEVPPPALQPLPALISFGWPWHGNEGMILCGEREGGE